MNEKMEKLLYGEENTVLGWFVPEGEISEM